MRPVNGWRASSVRQRRDDRQRLRTDMTFLPRFVRDGLDRLPEPARTYFFDALMRCPVVRHRPWLATRRWVRDEYTPFGRAERKRIMLSIARFAHINRPIEGYYFEFGCHEANTMRMAWDCFHHLFDWTFVAFDSFAGLPPVEKNDQSTIFYGGNLATSESVYIDLVTRHGMQRDRLITVKGFYDDTLDESLRNRLLPRKAAVVYVDCDLYKSAVPVLRFIVPFLQKGTIIVFDDWNCYYASPDFGERRAWREFTEAHPNLRFERFVATAEAQSFVCVGPG